MTSVLTKNLENGTLINREKYCISSESTLFVKIKVILQGQKCYMKYKVILSYIAV